MGNQCCSHQGAQLGFSHEKSKPRSIPALSVQPATQSYISPIPCPAPNQEEPKTMSSPQRWALTTSNQTFLEKYKALGKKILETVIQSKSILSQAKWKEVLQPLDGIYLTVNDRGELMKLLYQMLKIEFGQEFTEEQKEENLFGDQINKFDFCEQAGSKFQKIFKRIKNRKSQTSQVFSLIRDFSSFKSDFSDIKKIAKRASQLCKKDINAFSFVTLYLVHCTNEHLNSNPNEVFEIADKLKTIFNELSSEYPPSTVDKQEDEVEEVGQNLNINYDTCINYPMIKFKSSDPDDKIEQVQEEINKKAKLAKQNKFMFDFILEPICLKRGKHFQSALKIKSNSQSDTLSNFRVVEKILFQPQIEQLKKWLEDNKNSLISSVAEAQDYNKLVAFNQKWMQGLNYVEKLLVQNKKQIPFTCTDLLRGKAMFKSRSDISKTAQEILDQFKRYTYEQNYVVLQTEDRLGKPTKDFKMIFQIGGTISELQLAKQMNKEANEFNHKLYELKRSKGFSPFFNLWIFNERLSEIFFTDQLQLCSFMIQSREGNFVAGQEGLQTFEKVYLQKNVTAYHEGAQQFDRLFTSDRATLLEEIDDMFEQIEGFLDGGYPAEDDLSVVSLREYNDQIFMN